MGPHGPHFRPRDARRVTRSHVAAMGGVSLKALFGAMLPFALVALVQFYRSTVLTAGTGIERKPAAQQQARANRAGPAPFDGQLEPGMRDVSASLRASRSLAERAPNLTPPVER